MNELLNFVGGAFLPSEQSFVKVSPVDGTIVARVHEASRRHLPRSPIPSLSAHRINAIAYRKE